MFVGRSTELALVGAALRRARRQGLQTALVRAVPLGEPVTYALVDDLLRTLGSHSGDASGPSGVGAAVATLVAALAEWASGKPSLVTIDDLPSTV